MMTNEERANIMNEVGEDLMSKLLPHIGVLLVTLDRDDSGGSAALVSTNLETESLIKLLRHMLETHDHEKSKQSND